MNRYAVIDQSNVVINVIAWDGNAEWSPPPDTQAVHCADTVQIGWTYSNSTFHAPQVT